MEQKVRPHCDADPVTASADPGGAGGWDDPSELSRAGPNWPGLYTSSWKRLWMGAVLRRAVKSARWLSAPEASLKGLTIEDG